ncbi:helix-turn-helix transcriptional regulator [Nocardiopsis sp. NPDC007018]|uniref:helix-turn-helix domain-containing protein n=1 Tax=Nocardiopsis sp. NPDC007018 TaxID=3155721 RepID=UPI0034104DB1
MRSPTYSPTVRRRRLGMQLRRMREASGLTVAEASDQSKIPRTTLGKIETAETQKVQAGHLARLVDLYKVPHDEAEALRQLARDAGEKGWWWRYRDIFGHGALPDFEAEASVIRTYESLTIPGLLQTPQYTEAIFRGGPLTTVENIDRQVEARMRRREILHRHDDPPTLWAVIDEAALRRPIGGWEVMADQLDYLARIGQNANIHIQTIPYTAGAYSGIGAPFTVLEFPEPLDPTIVYTDSMSGGQFEEDPQDVERYTATFAHIQGAAASTVESATVIERIREESTTSNELHT